MSYSKLTVTRSVHPQINNYTQNQLNIKKHRYKYKKIEKNEN